jgi:hypothetical protein
VLSRALGTVDGSYVYGGILVLYISELRSAPLVSPSVVLSNLSGVSLVE